MAQQIIDLDGCNQHHDFLISIHTDWTLAYRVARECEKCEVIITN